ncbi:hypothetical protein AK830_g5182 [Neonectria ditissima]|uniref:NAD(P)-binding domain-containing protein n=1 Tax=Neonectria ditissima TaxID=78410 RepID=A0A0P7BMD0_9HYPO|nr:hypothetical protein AK830_g5182 [Neonectria ditissima]
MVSFQTVKQSNAAVANLPKGLVALFIGATSAIGQSALEHFSQNASSPRIHSVARSQTASSHAGLLASLRQSNPTGTYNLITADVSLISEIDKVVNAVTQKETKLDILIIRLAPGGLGAGGGDGGAAQRGRPGPARRGALVALERVGALGHDGHAGAREAGARTLFLATSDRYAVNGGLVPVPEGLEVAKKSDGGIFLVDPQGESTGDEELLADFRARGVDEAVWSFTQKVFAAAQESKPKDEL